MKFNNYSLSQAFENKKLRYLVIGGWNTFFGYITGVFLFLILNSYLHLIIIAILANIIAISMAFITYKLFIFRTRGNWLVEYLRCYIVYGFNAFWGILFLWFLVNKVGLNIWIAQGVAISATVIVSYFLHQSFTFRSNSIE